MAHNPIQVFGQAGPAHKSYLPIYLGFDGTGARYSEKHSHLFITSTSEEDGTEYIIAAYGDIKSREQAVAKVKELLKLDEPSEAQADMLEKVEELLTVIETMAVDPEPENTRFGGFSNTQVNEFGLVTIQWPDLTLAAVELYEAKAEWENSK